MITAEKARKAVRRNVREAKLAEEAAEKGRHQQIIKECEQKLPGWIAEAEQQITKSTENTCLLSQTIREGLHYPHSDGAPQISDLIQPFQDLIAHFVKASFKASLELDIDTGAEQSYYRIRLTW